MVDVQKIPVGKSGTVVFKDAERLRTSSKRLKNRQSVSLKAASKKSISLVKLKFLTVDSFKSE